MSDEDPWKIVALKNPDKELHEKSAANDDPLNLLHPSRVLLAGKPNSGVTRFMLRNNKTIGRTNAPVGRGFFFCWQSTNDRHVRGYAPGSQIRWLQPTINGSSAYH